jgi:hypothetical protein
MIIPSLQVDLAPDMGDKVATIHFLYLVRNSFNTQRSWGNITKSNMPRSEYLLSGV